MFCERIESEEKKPAFCQGLRLSKKNHDCIPILLSASLIFSALNDKKFTMRTKKFNCVLISIVAFICVSSADKMGSVEIATYEEVKDLPKHPEKLLIDVREPAEISETGSIPTSINIPRKF